MNGNLLRGACALVALASACSNTSPDGPRAKPHDAGVEDAATVGPTAGSGRPVDGRDASQGSPVGVAPPGSGVADSGVDAAMPRSDAGAVDSGTDSGTPIVDAGDPDPPPPTGVAHGRIEVVSGAGSGTGTVAGHRLRLTAGVSGVRGSGASAGYRLRLGAQH